MWTTQQQKVIAIVPKVSGSLSVAGDLYIVYDILSDRKKWKNSYHRIILGMSIVDFLCSAMYIWSSWAIPADVDPYYGIFQPSGNIHTCNVQGFFIQFGVAAPMYNASLCFYYYAVIVKGWKEYQVKKLEISMHVVVLAVGLATALIGLIMEQYNNMMTICWIFGDPFGCEFDPTVPCTRGKNAFYYRMALFLGPLWTTQIISTIALARVFCYVHTQEKLSSKWRQTSSQRRKTKLTQEVLWQSFWYLLAFYVTWIPGSIENFTYANTIVVYSTMPLQGFLNCLIYERPNYMRWVKKHPRFAFWPKIYFCCNAFKKWIKHNICKVPLDGVGENDSDMQDSTHGGSSRMELDPNVRILSPDESSTTTNLPVHENMEQRDQKDRSQDNPADTFLASRPIESSIEHVPKNSNFIDETDN